MLFCMKNIFVPNPLFPTYAKDIRINRDMILQTKPANTTFCLKSKNHKVWLRLLRNSW